MDKPIISPSFDMQTNNLILLLRTVVSGIVEATIFDSKPTKVILRYPDCVMRHEIGGYPLSTDERMIINTLRFLKFGKLTINIQENSGRYSVMGDSYQAYDCTREIDWTEYL